MSFYDKVQKQLPVSKAELNIIFVVIVGLVALNAASFFNDGKPSKETKADIIAMFDSLTEQSRKPLIAKIDTFKIDIRTADKFQLTKLKGIGDKTAQKIIEFRRNNYFEKTADIQKIKGIGPKTYQKMLPHLLKFGEAGSDTSASILDVSKESVEASEVVTSEKVNSDSKARININTASQDILEQLPGIGETYAKRIIEYRSLKPFKKIEDIKNIKGIGEKKFEKLKEFIEI